MNDRFGLHVRSISNIPADRIVCAEPNQSGGEITTSCTPVSTVTDRTRRSTPNEESVERTILIRMISNEFHRVANP